MITLITMHELEGFTAHELGELHQLLTAKLAETAPDTAEHRNIRASLENVSRALAYARRAKVLPSP